jgi:beta-lactamase class A
LWAGAGLQPNDPLYYNFVLLLRNVQSLFSNLGILLCLFTCGLNGADSDKSLDQRVRGQIAAFSGTVRLYAKNLDTGAVYGVRENERVRTASTIKLPIMVTIFDTVTKGQAQWSQRLPITEEKKVSGSGVVRELSAGVHLPVRDLMHLMIVVSDNTATNLLLDRFPGDSVNAELDRLGLHETRSLRKILGDGNDLKPEVSGVSAAGRLPENQKFGIGVSTPREMVMLLEMIANGQAVSKEASSEMIAILKRQQYKDGIGRHLPGAMVASKSGALDHLRSDVGIVYSKGGRIAIAITCDDMPKIDWSPENAGNVLISKLTGLILEGLGSKP